MSPLLNGGVLKINLKAVALWPGSSWCSEWVKPVFKLVLCALKDMIVSPATGQVLVETRSGGRVLNEQTAPQPYCRWMWAPIGKSLLSLSGKLAESQGQSLLASPIWDLKNAGATPKKASGKVTSKTCSGQVLPEQMLASYVAASTTSSHILGLVQIAPTGGQLRPFAHSKLASCTLTRPIMDQELKLSGSTISSCGCLQLLREGFACTDLRSWGFSTISDVIAELGDRIHPACWTVDSSLTQEHFSLCSPARPMVD
ncbi:hypothetical protein CTAM01_16964 [Colletotrichum tamarilloi]|uniref:Uncharacterized protein n=1 Tax=Colletotrichum tamarilloi TaxID=1209934 RepID=A0ABQ9QH75_9PEZI|nr:uncharacterized protein CTAM01_16964 [Colletotrichum tamarilloi]KAK1468086.1 hypothetical protein CTAM01_16964 [Colletotrichum tamarilloi]